MSATPAALNVANNPALKMGTAELIAQSTTPNSEQKTSVNKPRTITRNGNTANSLKPKHPATAKNAGKVYRPALVNSGRNRCNAHELECYFESKGLTGFSTKIHIDSKGLTANIPTRVMSLCRKDTGGLPLFRKIESFIAGLPPYAALATFGAASVLLIPVKLAALYLIAYGQPIKGLMTFIGAKIAGTALVARIFALTQHNLLRIGWFTWLYDRFLAFKTYVHEAIKSNGIYKAAHRLRLLMRAALIEFSRGRRTLWRSRLEAVIRQSRR